MIIEKNNKGLLFKNSNAITDRHPKWKGNAQVDGKQWVVSIWEGKTKKGDDKLSLTFQTEEEAAQWKNQDPDPNQKYESVKEVQEVTPLSEDELPF